MYRVLENGQLLRLCPWKDEHTRIFIMNSVLFPGWLDTRQTTL